MLTSGLLTRIKEEVSAANQILDLPMALEGNPITDIDDLVERSQENLDNVKQWNSFSKSIFESPGIYMSEKFIPVPPISEFTNGTYFVSNSLDPEINNEKTISLIYTIKKAISKSNLINHLLPILTEDEAAMIIDEASTDTILEQEKREENQRQETIEERLKDISLSIQVVYFLGRPFANEIYTSSVVETITNPDIPARSAIDAFVLTLKNAATNPKTQAIDMEYISRTLSKYTIYGFTDPIGTESGYDHRVLATYRALGLRTMIYEGLQRGKALPPGFNIEQLKINPDKYNQLWQSGRAYDHMRLAALGLTNPPDDVFEPVPISTILENTNTPSNSQSPQTDIESKAALSQDSYVQQRLINIRNFRSKISKNQQAISKTGISDIERSRIVAKINDDLISIESLLLEIKVRLGL